MSNRNKVKFKVHLANGQTGKFWRAAMQPYSNMEISAGLISGLEPDTIYLRFDKDGITPTTIFMRPDEAMAVLHVLSGALWSAEIFTMDDTKKRTRTMQDATEVSPQ